MVSDIDRNSMWSDLAYLDSSEGRPSCNDELPLSIRPWISGMHYLCPFSCIILGVVFDFARDADSSILPSVWSTYRIAILAGCNASFVHPGFPDKLFRLSEHNIEFSTHTDNLWKPEGWWSSEELSPAREIAFCWKWIYLWYIVKTGCLYHWIWLDFVWRASLRSGKSSSFYPYSLTVELFVILNCSLLYTLHIFSIMSSASLLVSSDLACTPTWSSEGDRS